VLVSYVDKTNTMSDLRGLIMSRLI